MPRTARKLSSTGIYHIILRGINQEYIFKENRYKHKMIRIIKEKLEDTSVEIYGYCIMDNHIHIILKSDTNKISTFMAKTNCSYARYYNSVNERCGYVFQNRFKSYPIEQERYFWSCLRYIHNNPVNANVVKNPYLYKWCSYQGYCGGDDFLLDNKAYTLMQNNFINEKDFLEFHMKKDYELHPDIKEDVKVMKNMISEHIWEITLKNYNCNTYMDLCMNETAMKYLKTKLKEQAELNNKQIEEFIKNLKTT